MAEDGMFLNFAIQDTSVATRSSAPKFRGGSWRERRRLNNHAKQRDTGIQNGQPRLATDAAYVRATRGKENIPNGDFENSRPSKRRKENGEFTGAVQPQSRKQTAGNGSAKQSGREREIISSLFTYNPKPKEVETEPAEENAEPNKPSNAPLPDGIDTFTTLGLSSTLAAHLLTKMDLKNPTAIQKASISQLLKDDSDAFIQSETGSGKTLAYLLPLVQRIMGMTELSRAAEQGEKLSLHRDSGLFAIVLAPTRELCKQISVVLERLLGCANFIVAGTVLGGEKKKSEKARLRKGLNILVATPGRLVDHLENTKSLDISNVRYLILDEGDRLMDLGFEEDITKIVRALDSKKRKSTRPGLPERRITMLCSATLKMNVQKLGDISLKDAVHIKSDLNETDAANDAGDKSPSSAFLAPAQLKQSYIVAAAKLRLVTLTALLRRTFARKGSVMKAIVFVSCADSVEFHFKAFTRLPKPESIANVEFAKDEDPTESKATSEQLSEAILPSPLLSSGDNALTVYKLHGSLPQSTRTSIVKTFAASTQPSLLIATDVASRGLDLPNLDLIIEYDPAFSTDEHLHRIGRTARLGRDGRAIIFLLPGKEENYVDILKQSFKQDVLSSSSSNVTSQSCDDVLRKGFTSTTGVVSQSNKEWESKATDFQLEIERWILSDQKLKELARKAFTSHIRAYATHVAQERQYFDIKELHLGHLAKSFGLRDPPGKVNVQGARSGRQSAATNEGRKRKGRPAEVSESDARNEVGSAKARKADIDESRDADDAAKRMRDMVRNRKRMMGAGAEEFNIA